MTIAYIVRVFPNCGVLLAKNSIICKTFPELEASFGRKMFSRDSVSPILWQFELYFFHICVCVKKFYSIRFPYDPLHGPYFWLFIHSLLLIFSFNSLLYPSLFDLCIQHTHHPCLAIMNNLFYFPFFAEIVSICLVTYSVSYLCGYTSYSLLIKIVIVNINKIAKTYHICLGYLISDFSENSVSFFPFRSLLVVSLF